VAGVVWDRDPSGHTVADLFQGFMVIGDFQAEDITTTGDYLTGGMPFCLFGEIIIGVYHPIPFGFT